MSDRCFNNSLILQTILNIGFQEKAEYYIDPREHFKLRLVNKRFNTEYLHWVRKRHRKIDIKYHYPSEEQGSNFFVNVHRTDSKKAPGFFKFLTDVAQVKIEECRLVSTICYSDSISEQQMLHDLIMPILRNYELKVFTGFADFCEHGCMDCEVHTGECEEADFQFNVLIGFAKRRKHFKKLIVTSLLIRNIAIYCTSLSNTKEQCMEVLASLITSNISCDHLQFALDGVLIHLYPWDREVLPIEPAIPLEVLTRILEAWKPKSIDLKFHSNATNNRCSGPWVEKGLFSEFRFDTDPQLFCQNFLAHTGFSFEKAEVNVESCLPVPDDDEGADFSRFVENVRTLFPTDHLVLSNYQLMYNNMFYRTFNHTELEKMLELAATPKPFRITAKIAVWTLYGFEIPDTFHSWSKQRFHCSVCPSSKTLTTAVDVFPGVSVLEFVGKTFRITDDSGKFQLDLEIYVGVYDFEMAQKTENEKDDLKKGFLKHFL